MPERLAGPFCELAGDRLRLYVRVSPKASRDRIEGVEMDGAGRARLRIRVTAPPDKGAANARVAALLAKALRIAPSRVEVGVGAQDRNKTLLISGGDEDLMARIRALAGETT
jgi:uncharacterized protein (TIGR00251 family)